MTDQVQQVEQVEEQQPVEDNASFEAGFAQARGEEPPEPVAEEPKAEAAEEPIQEAAEEAAPQGEPQPVVEDLFEGLTKEQVKNLLLKAGEVDGVKEHLEKAFGKLGEFKKEMLQMQQTRSGGVKLDATSLKRLHAAYPEMAEDLAADLSESLVGAGGGAAIDPAQFETLVTERLSAKEAEIERKLERKFEERWLTRQHKDWRDVVKSSDFQLWQNNVLKPEEAQELVGSEDSVFIAEKLTAFKDWRDRSVKAKQDKQKRLEAAVVPTGGTAPFTQSSEDPFLAGFKQARGNR